MSAYDVRTVKRYYCKCERCGHEWQTETTRMPKRCAGCKKPGWNFKAGTLPRGRPLGGKGKPRKAKR